MTGEEWVAVQDSYLERVKIENKIEENRARKVAYQSYVLSFMFSKKRPKSLDSWWPLEKKDPRQYKADQPKRQKAYAKLRDNLSPNALKKLQKINGIRRG